MPMIKIEHLSKSYGKTKAVDDVSLDIAAGEIFGLLGPNGAGKTTTILMLCGLLPIDAGSIWVDALNVSRDALTVKRKMGLVPQDVAIYSGLSAWENVEFFGRLHGLKGKPLEQQVAEALDFVGLSDRAHDRPTTFSNGMKRRLNIACAILHRPQLIIMDEPTVGIDPQSRNHILDSVRGLNRNGSTIVYTSHYIEEVEALCSRVAIMDYGRIIACGTPEEIKANAQDDEIIDITVKQINSGTLDGLRSLERVRTVQVRDGNKIEIVINKAQEHLQDILLVLLNNDAGINELKIRERNLETVFLSLTGRKLRD